MSNRIPVEAIPAARGEAVRAAAEAFQMRDLDNARIWSTRQVAEILYRIADDMEADHAA